MGSTFRSFFFAELIVIVLVVSTFKLVPEKIVAGAITGTMFVTIGLWIFVNGWMDRRMMKTVTFAAATLHLFVSALPLMITRLMNATLGFEEVRVLGLPGPVFHQVSTTIYFALLIATAFDWWRTSRTNKNAAQ